MWVRGDPGAPKVDFKKRWDGVNDSVGDSLSSTESIQEVERINSSARPQREINLCLSFCGNGQESPGPADL